MSKSLIQYIISFLVLCGMLCPSMVYADYETGGVTKTILSNGVTLLVKQETESKTVAVEVFVRTGALDENPGNTGIGQLLAGSILAGTTTRSTGRLSRLVAEAGGNFHSQWQWNYTEVYAVTLPSASLEAVSIIADSIQNSSLDPQSIEYSRSTILKEIGRQEDDPFNSAYTSVRSQLYSGTPYGRPYLGKAEIIRRITSEQVRAFYQKNFVADRIVVSVVGSVDPDAVARKVETCFKNMSMGFVEPKPVSSLSPAGRYVQMKKTGAASYIMVAYPAPGVEDKDYMAMCIANVLLGGNKSSLLFTRLREQKGFGYQVGSQYPAFIGRGHMIEFLGMDSSRATPETVKSVESAMIDQAGFLMRGEFSDKDFDRAKKYLIGKHALNHERIRDRAFNLGWAETMGLGYQFDLPMVYSEAVNKVTRDDVIRVCKQYLSDPVALVYSGNEDK